MVMGQVSRIQGDTVGRLVVQDVLIQGWSRNRTVSEELRRGSNGFKLKIGLLLLYSKTISSWPQVKHRTGSPMEAGFWTMDIAVRVSGAVTTTQWYKVWEFRLTEQVRYHAPSSVSLLPWHYDIISLLAAILTYTTLGSPYGVKTAQGPHVIHYIHSTGGSEGYNLFFKLVTAFLGEIFVREFV